MLNPRNTLSITLKPDNSLSASTANTVCTIRLQVNKFPTLTKYAIMKTVSIANGTGTIVNFEPSERPSGQLYLLGISCQMRCKFFPKSLILFQPIFCSNNLFKFENIMYHFYKRIVCRSLNWNCYLVKIRSQYLEN